MAKRPSSANPFSQVQIHPLSGGLDSRSRPADIAAGAFRHKLNMSMSRDGKLCRRGGHASINDTFADLLADPANFDLHHQGITREPINFGFEFTRSNGVRYLFAGTQDSLFILNDGPHPGTVIAGAAGTWETVMSGYGATGAYWRAAASQDIVVFTNGVKRPVYADASGTTWTPGNPLPAYQPGGLSSSSGSFVSGGMLNLTIGSNLLTAQVVISFSGFILLMNLTDDDQGSFPARVGWGDMNSPQPDAWGAYNPYTSQNSVAGYQDLDAGDPILAAIQLLGNVYIFTQRAIWRMSVGNTADPAAVFSFQKIYSEPMQQTGCLAYPRSLISTGLDLYWLGREAPYHWNPYVLVPESEDWLYKASGYIYKSSANIQIDETICNGPVGAWVPNSRELWWSWPHTDPITNPYGHNNYTMVAQLDQKTADMIDMGYSVLFNFRRTPVSGQQCNQDQLFVGCSTDDYALKTIGGIFVRSTYVITGDITDDLDLATVPVLMPYNSVLRGLIPTGLTDRDKIIRLTHIEADVTPEAHPAGLTVRIGNTYSLQDPLEGSLLTGPGDMAGAGSNVCAVAWGEISTKPLACANAQTMAQLKAGGFRPSRANDYPVFQTGRMLYFEVGIVPTGNNSYADVCFDMVAFEIQPLAKP